MGWLKLHSQWTGDWAALELISLEILRLSPTLESAGLSESTWKKWKHAENRSQNLGEDIPRFNWLPPPPSVDVMATTDKLTNYISQGKVKRTLQFLRLCAQYLQENTTCEWHILYKHINASNCKIHQGTSGTYIWQNHALAQMKIWFHMTYIVIPIRNTASSSFAILMCCFNLKALLDISGEANQRLLPIGCQWSTTRPVKCWTFEGPWTAVLSWWSCDLLVLPGHFFLPKASRKSKRQLSRLTKFDDHDEGKWEGRRTAYAFIERIHQQIHQETTKNR